MMEEHSGSNIPPYNLITEENQFSSYKIYELIDLFGNGRLVELTRTALKTKRFAEVDQVIRDEIPKFLYRDGQGAHVSKEELILKRTSEQDKKFLDKEKKNLLKNRCYEQTIESLGKRFICFDLEKRGRIGETLLHLCFLNTSPAHNEIAKRLVKHYPNMINDIFISDEYYGQTALHLAIVNEDLYMVRYLLHNGANIHERNCGRFFCTDDQKCKRKPTFKCEYATLPMWSNYSGISYFGEYPLSVAVSLNQIDCVRLLLAFNADITKQDSNGNTALHMSVIHDHFEIFKMLIESDSDHVAIRVKNNQQYTALTLAVKLGKKEFFDYTNERIRNIYWTYGDVSCAAYFLQDMDSIKDNGEIDIKSAIHLAFNSEEEHHLEFLEGFLLDLLTKKWNLYIRNKFYVEVILFLVYFVLTGVTILLKRIFFDSLNSLNCLEYEPEFTALKSECSCAYLLPEDDDKYVRTILEIIVILYSLGYVIINIDECYVQRLNYIRTLRESPTKITFFLSNLSLLMIVPMRFLCITYGEDVLLVLSILLMATYAVHLGRGFPYMSTFTFVIHKVLKTNFFRFFVIYAIFIMGYSQSFYIAYGFGNAPVTEVFYSPLQSIFDTLVLSVGDILIPYDNLILTTNQTVGKLLLVTYLIMVTLLLVNILIAMMLHTYDHTFENKNEWLRQWGKHVLSIEENYHTKQRLKHKQKYSQKSADGENIIIIRWRLTPDERLESYDESMGEFRHKLLESKEIDLTAAEIERFKEE